MAPTSLASGTGTPPLEVREVGDGAAVFVLAGRWLLDRHRAEPSEILRQLPAQIRSLGFDAQALESWDTSLLTLIHTVEAGAASRGITVDRAGLPGGLRRLLELLESAPVRRVTTAQDPDPEFVEQVGLAALAVGARIGQYVRFLGEIVLGAGRLARGRAHFRRTDMVGEMQRAGVEALPVVTLVNFLLGLILAFVGAIQLEMFGAAIYVADLVGVGMVRDMAALMTAIVMAGRSGASYAAQIGTMQVSQEVDALETFGISPIDFLVLPRVIALSLMVPLLTLYADVVGMLGGASVGLTMLGLTPAAYYQQTVGAVGVGHLLGGVFKAATYGALVAVAGCYQGLHASRSAAGVGEAATTAVVRGIVSIIAACGLFAFLFYLLGW